jgi:hypothetical protein
MTIESRVHVGNRAAVVIGNAPDALVDDPVVTHARLYHFPLDAARRSPGRA